MIAVVAQILERHERDVPGFCRASMRGSAAAVVTRPFGAEHGHGEESDVTRDPQRRTPRRPPPASRAPRSPFDEPPVARTATRPCPPSDEPRLARTALPSTNQAL